MEPLVTTGLKSAGLQQNRLNFEAKTLQNAPFSCVFEPKLLINRPFIGISNLLMAINGAKKGINKAFIGINREKIPINEPKLGINGLFIGINRPKMADY